MDRSKSNSNYKDIICGAPFDPIGILQELSRLRHQPVEIIKTKQEDAHELLCQLLSEIHDEICQILYHSSSNKNGKGSKSAVGIQKLSWYSSAFVEESTSSSDLSTMTADLQLNGDEKSEDWLQVGKRNRTHVLRTVRRPSFSPSPSKHALCLSLQNELQKSLITEIFAGKFRSIVHSAGNQKSVVHEPFFTLSLDIKVSDAFVETRCDLHSRFIQDPKITNLDEALARFCEQSAISDYVDNKNRPNVSSPANHGSRKMLRNPLLRFLRVKPC